MVAYLEKSDDNKAFHQIVDFLSSCSINYALTQIHAIADGKAVVISESSVRSDLLFDDEDGGSPMRQETIGGTAQTRSERVLEQPNEPPLSEGHTSGSKEGRMEHTFELMDTVPPTTYDLPLRGGYTHGSDEGRLKLLELMNICTTLSNRVTTLENDLSSTKAIYHKSFITLTKRVKKLEMQLKQKRNRAVIHSLDEEEPSLDIEYSPKQRRMIREIDKDENVNLLKQKRNRAVIHSLDEEEPSLDIEYSPKQRRMIREIDKDENVNLVSEQGELHETAEPQKDDDDDATLAEYQKEYNKR
nr:hypothetical protein [Tanacetum cinerariifolium]